MSLRYSLLDERLIRTRLSSDGNAAIFSLPGLFVALAEDAVRDFPALRLHQRHPWRASLVQLAAIALHHHEVSIPFTREAEWKEALLSLTPDDPDGAPWYLVAPPERPALLQAPVPEGSIAEWEDNAPTPDALDLRVTSKNHELKQRRIAAARPDDWLLALVSLQTAGPYPGRGHFGVARMNGGSSSRPGLGICPPGGPGRRWLRDVRVAVAERATVVEEMGYMPTGGIALLWLQPWDGVSAYSLAALDPFFIEICRRVRLVAKNGRLRARRKTSTGPRISKQEAKSRKGNTGDLWTPVTKAQGKSLHVTEQGFDYRHLSELLFGNDWRKPPAQVARPEDDEEGVMLIARAIAGGQSTTAGYHERRVPTSPQVRRMLVGRGTDLLTRAAGERVDAVARIRNLLRGSLEILFDDGKKRRDSGDIPDSIREKAAQFVKPFERGEDLRFFDELNIEIESSDRDKARLNWCLSMAERARTILIGAFVSGPRSGEQRYRARVAALSRFDTGLRSDKVLPALAAHYRKQHSEQSTDDAACPRDPARAIPPIQPCA